MWKEHEPALWSAELPRVHAGSTGKGILTPCVMLDQPAVDLKKIPMTTAWQQLLEEAKELVSHTECEGCHLRPVCNVCYAAAHCEKTITGGMDYLCQMAKAKERIITNYPPVIH